MPTLLQLTDLHLFADRGALLKGINPWHSLTQVLETMRTRKFEFDHLVLTGDLTHDGQRRTYEQLRDALGEWSDRTWAIPGNHDERSHVGEVFNLPQPSADAPDLNDRVTFAFPAADWRVIGLDTLVPGELRGELGREQLDWLERELARHATSPTLIFLHHPPVDVHSGWLDKIGLTDRQDLCRLVESSPEVKLIACGHIHQRFQAHIGSATLLAAPSTSVQFRPGTESLVCDDPPPGFRVIHLEGDGWQSEVVRAEQ